MSRYWILVCPTCGRREQVLVGQTAWCPNDHPRGKANRMLPGEPSTADTGSVSVASAEQESPASLFEGTA